MPLILKATIAAVPFLMPAANITTLARACAAPVAILTKGCAPPSISPNLSCISPSFASNCTCLPTSVAPNAAFISPTLLVITCANIAARSLSVPYFSTCSSASLNVIPTRVSAEVCPCITLPIKLPTFTASCPVAAYPFCCAIKLFIAGSKVSILSACVKKVAICCAPISCTSSSTTPFSRSASASALILSISCCVAFIRCAITVVSLVSASTA